ncbi:hypothetical protein [Paenibacillus sp. FSL L8-0499]|uniref:hypothetical protein n=1 Tax=Paenibacillus sp. FSL L8-0499 TaxID=2975334 RepID=UPI0030F56221
MSKLTKTIEENKKWNQHFEEHPEDNLLTKLEPVNKTISYLLSLLEEKDKALAFYADRDNYDFNGRHSIPMFNDNGDIARKAINTSSNNKGE